MNRKIIGEAIYIRVSDRKYNPIATKRGNVLTQSWRSKSAVFRMYCPLTLNGYSNFINAVKRQRNLGLHTYICKLKLAFYFVFFKMALYHHQFYTIKVNPLFIQSNLVNLACRFIFIHANILGPKPWISKF